MKGIYTWIFLIGIFPVLGGCEKFEYDPNQSVDVSSEERLNYININSLRAHKNDSVIRFVLIGDTHIDYENTERVVNTINSLPGIDFVIHAGDLTEHGILQEYKWKADYLKKLRMPFLVVMGNHDAVGKGDRMYENMFGHKEFDMIYGNTKFIFFNSNSREYGNNGAVPNLGWVGHEIVEGSGYRNVVLVSHVPFFDNDFDQSMRDDYITMVNKTHEGKKVLASLNGHVHDGFEYTSGETDIPHLAPGSINRRTFMVMEVKNDSLTYEKHRF